MTKPSTKTKVMLVDDDAVIHGIVVPALKKNGFEVIQAWTGTEMLNLLPEKKPDIIILDVILPDMDGTDIVGILQDKPDTIDIPVVYLTGLAGEEEAGYVPPLGSKNIFSKPVDTKALIEKIQKIAEEFKHSRGEVFRNDAIFNRKVNTKKILVVDDDQHILSLLESRLSYYGFQVLCAVNGKNAILKAKQQLPDLIILDIMLPGIDGTEVARMLKQDDETKEIPIIFVTALKSQSDQLPLENFGQSVVIAKPFQPEQLMSKINQMLKIDERVEEL